MLTNYPETVNSLEVGKKASPTGFKLAVYPHLPVNMLDCTGTHFTWNQNANAIEFYRIPGANPGFIATFISTFD